MLIKNEILHDRYQITGQLGRGGMGAVYEAADLKRFGKAVAVKEILIEPGEKLDREQRELMKQAFEREAKILTGLDHEAFPQVVDYFVEADRQFLAMELIPGENLSKLLENRKKPFAIEEVLRWAEELLDALDYLHTLENAVYHRDIKPQNLKLTARGRIKLLDFGIAKASDATAGLTITNQTFVAATLHYSPLEQIIKAIDPNYREYLLDKFGARVAGALTGKTDERSDIYALGATVYHLLTSALPVDSLKRAIRIFEGKDDPLPNPQKLNGQLPAAVSEWILKAMEIERENRFAGAAEMRSALRKVLEAGRNRETAENLQRETARLREERRLIEAERRKLAELHDKDFSRAETLSILSEAVEAEAEKELSFENRDAGQFIEGSFTVDLSGLSLLNSRTATSYLQGIDFGSEQIHEARAEPLETVEIRESVEIREAIPPKPASFRFIPVLALILLVVGFLGAGLWFLSGEPVAQFDDSEITVTDTAAVIQPKVDFDITPAANFSAVESPAVEKQPANEPVAEDFEKKAQPKPAPAKIHNNKPKKQPPATPVTVDDIINDN